MKVCGFEGVSLLDYPGRVSAVIFLGGCNFRCPFCHNADLVLRPGSLPALSVDQVVSRVVERRNLIDGVVLSGGEPLIHGEGLVALLEALHGTGVAVKLDTNGYEVETLLDVLDSGLVDYVAMDVKTSLARYSVAAGRSLDPARIEEAVRAINSSGVAHEFRTTCVPGIVGIDDVVEIARLIGPDSRLYLQQFRASGGVIDPSYEVLQSYPAERLREFAASAEPFVASVHLRGC